MSKISRRDFLKGAMAGAAGLAATSVLGACANEGVAPAECPEVAETTATAVNDWLGTAPVVAADKIKSTLECDVLVVGCGTAGTFAACSAAENGAKTICIDQWPEGASSGIRDTISAIGSKQQIANNDNPDKRAVIKMLVEQASGNGNQDLYQLWADNSGEAIDWYTDLLAKNGLHFMHEVDDHTVPSHYEMYDVGHSIQWEGREYSPQFTMGYVNEYGKSIGVDYHFETKMIELVKSGDRVTGIIALNTATNEYLQINASKGVIMCTGGYARNYDMLKALQPETLSFASINNSFPGMNGDGIKACLWAGAQFDDIHTSMLFERAAIKPNQLATRDAIDPEGVLFWMGSQPFLKVNLDGKRFTNESAPYDFLLHTLQNQKDRTLCMVWDANYAKYIPGFETHGCSRLMPHKNGTESVMPLFLITDIMNPQLEADGYIVKADTIEELAEKLGIPADEFKKTVDRYNELYKLGEDLDYGKEAHRLSPMDTAPFYGVRQGGGYFITTMDGVKINTNLNVLDTTGRPIEGLFAAGDCSGGYFASTYPNLLAGAAAGRSVTFGRLAGRNAALGK